MKIYDKYKFKFDHKMDFRGTIGRPVSHKHELAWSSSSLVVNVWLLLFLRQDKIRAHHNDDVHVRVDIIV